ncbi:hypothetical protein ACIQBJ_16415 [Kitasatospora sp. NPDC088391]|uniref:hypothetical protein n=1 Tax=Kitasatospora sp. NPDC088391 TaxID=3364074 RepID=UPI00382E690F
MAAGTAVARVVLAIEVDESGGARRLSAVSDQLAGELTAARAVVTRIPAGDAPDHTKSGVFATAGELLVTTGLSVAGLRQLVRLAIAFVERGSARKITLESGGETFTAEGLSARTERQLADAWIAKVLAAGQSAADAAPGESESGGSA